MLSVLVLVGLAGLYPEKHLPTWAWSGLSAGGGRPPGLAAARDRETEPAPPDPTNSANVSQYRITLQCELAVVRHTLKVINGGLNCLHFNVHRSAKAEHSLYIYIIKKTKQLAISAAYYFCILNINEVIKQAYSK